MEILRRVAPQDDRVDSYLYILKQLCTRSKSGNKRLTLPLLPRNIPSMICRLLKNPFLAVIVAAGLSACMDGTPSNAALNPSTVAQAGKHYTHSHSHLYTHRASDGTLITTNIIDPPSNFSQAAGTGGSLWDRLRTNFQLPTAANRPQVQAQIKWFVHNQSYLDRTIKRAVPYMYLIFQETQSRNLPAELVLLPIMESAYNPFIRSSRGAVGLWQLMSGTANVFGVKQDFWYDGRRDVYASTNGALDYLTYLQSYFGGDWLLAIAAYDAGEGRLQSAVHHNAERGLSTDFWSLSLPVETQAYVPRLLALAAIISNPAKYNVTLPPITDQPYLQQVELGAPINLAQAAEMAGMSLNALKILNPGYSRTTTGPNGPYRLLLPIDRIPQFKERLAAMPELSNRTNWGRYKVQRGDTLDSIADRFDITVVALREANHLTSKHLPVGHVIMIPAGTQPVTPQLDDLATGQKTPLTVANVVDQAADLADSQTPALNQAATTSNNQAAAAVTTRAGDVSVSDDQDEASTSSAAEEETTENVQPAAPVKTAREKIYHTVKHGETLSMVARHYGVKTSDLQRWNKLKANKILKPGTRLMLYRTAQVQTRETKIKTAGSASAKAMRYTVRPGDNLIKIANRYNVKVANLRKWNHLTDNAGVKAGQKLVVYTEG